MQKEFARWGDPNNIMQQMIDFNNNHLVFGSELSQRTANVRNHIQSAFGLQNQVEVTLNVEPEGSGKIRISTVEPDSYPWNGVYFNGVPVKIEALPADGFAFINWDHNSLIDDTLNPIFNDTLKAQATQFTAYFANTTSTNELPETSEFIIFPNPAQDDLLVLAPHKLKGVSLIYTIINANGTVVKNGSFQSHSNQIRINTKLLPAGVYQISIMSSHSVIERLKFIKI
jgi:hypothetical protein